MQVQSIAVLAQRASRCPIGIAVGIRRVSTRCVLAGSSFGHPARSPLGCTVLTRGRSSPGLTA